jgi:hypothetical protein
MESLKHTTRSLLSMPFDLARATYAENVSAGLIEGSMLASAKFGKMITQWETVALGPLARSR